MTCAKRQVTCTIVTADKSAGAAGTNYCHNPQATCPREPHEGYDKCKSVCDQAGHAEEVALNNAKHFELDLRGAIATVTGIGWVCWPCLDQLRAAGIARVYVQEDE